MNLEQREKNWNKRYLEKDTPWEEEIPSLELASILKNYATIDSDIFEVGCGLGTNALYLASLGYRVSSSDISHESVRIAQNRVESGNNVNFFQHDFLSDKLDKKYDVMFERGCFHSFFNQESLNYFAKKAFDSLNDDGLWITISGNADNPDDLVKRKENSFPRLTLRSISQAVEPHFEILEMKRGKFGEINGFHSWVGVFKKRSYFYE